MTEVAYIGWALITGRMGERKTNIRAGNRSRCLTTTVYVRFTGAGGSQKHDKASAASRARKALGNENG